MANYNFKQWIKAAGIRAVRTVAQTAVGVIGGSVLMTDVDWMFVASASALAGICSVLMSVVTGLPEVDDAPAEITIPRGEGE